MQSSLAPPGRIRRASTRSRSAGQRGPQHPGMRGQRPPPGSVAGLPAPPIPCRIASRCPAKSRARLQHPQRRPRALLLSQPPPQL